MISGADLLKDKRREDARQAEMYRFTDLEVNNGTDRYWELIGTEIDYFPGGRGRRRVIGCI